MSYYRKNAWSVTQTSPANFDVFLVVICTQRNKSKNDDISASHSGDNEDVCPVWCCLAWSGRSLTMFERCWLPQSLLFALVLETVSTSWTKVKLYLTLPCSNPENSRLYTRRRQNLKSYQSLLFFVCLDRWVKKQPLEEHRKRKLSLVMCRDERVYVQHCESVSYWLTGDWDETLHTVIFRATQIWRPSTNMLRFSG
jgi:hypothetical protein